MLELIAELEKVESALESMMRRSKSVRESEETADSAIQSASASFALQDQIADAMLRRDEKNIEAIYMKYAKNGCGICKRDFLDALNHVRLEDIKSEDADEIFDDMDMDCNGLLDLKEFRRAVSAPSSFEQFINQAIPFSELISTALPKKKATNQLAVFMELTQTQISDIARAVSAVLKSILCTKAVELKESYDAAAAKNKTADNSSASKFSVVELKAGGISDYHKGLSGRVGKHKLPYSLPSLLLRIFPLY
jgi:hypothetical protein